MNVVTAFDQSTAANKIANALGTTHAAAASTAASSTSAATNAITSNDFLTLLVTEMKNQDPTQPTDPNAYIQQMVGVNSLQQLIAINQDLSGGSTAKPTGGVAVRTTGSA